MENCLKAVSKALCQHDNELKEVIRDGQGVLALLREVPDRPFHEVQACIDQAEMVMRDVVAWLEGASFDNERKRVATVLTLASQEGRKEIQETKKQLKAAGWWPKCEKERK